MTTDLTNMEKRLFQYVGETGLAYLAPQLDIIRAARNLPKDIEDKRLTTAKFYLALNVIRNWLAPVAELSQTLSEEEEQQLLELQEKARALVKTHNIVQWYEVKEFSDVNLLFHDIEQRLVKLERYKERILSDCWRDQISNLLSIIMYPYADHIDFTKAMEEAQAYLGHNLSYRKQNIYIDALILQKICVDIFKRQINATKIRKGIERRIPEIGFSRDSDREQWDLYRISQGTEGDFGTAQAELLAKKMLNLPRLSAEIREELSSCYIPEDDRYSILSLINWLSSKPEIASLLRPETPPSDDRSKRRPQYLLGLSFMDHHRRSDIVGNMTIYAANLFEQIMAPFNELKQQDAFLQSANFEIDVFGLPPIVWLYDFLGVKSEILRSTLLLISDRQPKFDILESCQRLANAVLGGRVDRNSYREPGSNFFQVNLLPQSTWTYVSDMLSEILEETLVLEEDRALRILRSVFAEEDRSQLVTSKKFLPAFHMNYQFSQDERTGKRDFHEVSVFAREDFSFQPRHIQAGGYPWYLQVNSILESLVAEALRVSDIRKLHENISLRQVVFKRIQERSFLIHYAPNLEKNSLTVMGFREADLIEEATSAVEVLHRPMKFLDRGPEKNILVPILDRVSATDPKDLYSIISSL